MKERGVVLGAGISGVGAALLAKKQGMDVFVSDASTIDTATKKLLDQYQIDWEETQHSIDKMQNVQWVVKSPGIPSNAPILSNFREQNCPILSEIEFAAKFTDALIIGITGSNGKTTTAMLTYHLLKEAGLNVGLGGNVGYSFAQQVAEEQFEVYVLEISSFQLDDIHTFQPHIAVITNITPDHLDRYNYDFQQYIAAKLKITKNQTSKNMLLFNADDAVLKEALFAHKTAAKIHAFGFTSEMPKPYTTHQEDALHIIHEKDQKMIPTNAFSLQGRHNLLNAMAAATVADLFKVSKESIRQSLATFKGVPHRLEPVLTIQNVRYINDSKATNVNATYYALECMDAPTVWIVGGVDKGNDYSALLPLVHEKIKAIICLGVDNQKLFEAFQPIVEIMVETTSVTEAVKIARKIAEKKDNVLLSPACASFDLFKNYEDRGNQFKAAVRNL